MKKLLLPATLLIFIMACNKDKFQTKPQIEIKSINTTVVPVNGSLVITLTFTDKEGDVSDSLFVKKKRLNLTIVQTIRDSIRYKIPDFPDHSKGEMQVTLDYQAILSAITPPPIPGSNPPRNQPDTLIVKFAVRDKAGNASDTLSTDKIVVIR